MKDYIDIQERPSWGRMLPLSFQHLFAMFGSTVLVPYLLKVDPATALFMNGIVHYCTCLCVRVRFLHILVPVLPLLRL